jgi:hypothetical protein
MSNFTSPPTKAAGNTLASSDWNTYLKQNLDKGVNRPLSDSLLAAPAASVVFSSIDQNFRHLRLVVQARGDTAATNVGLLLRFNGDTGANYDRQFFQASGSSSASSESIAGTSIEIAAGLLPANTAPASSFGQVIVDIAYYAGANHKTVTVQGATKVNTTTGNFVNSYTAGWWRSTAAITSVTLLTASGNLVAGTVTTLYGLAF